MATGGADAIAPLLEELLTCDVCQEEFNSTTRPPRVLPCYHSFCGVCLQKLTKDGKVKCPKCRQEASADKPFQMDTLRMSVMDWKQSVLNVEGKACEGCSVEAKATSKCQDCAEYYCSDCTSYHRKLKITKDHTLVSLSEAAKSPEKLIQTLSEKCESHPDEKLKLFCLTCDKAVCSICALTQHLKGHEFMELPKVLEDMKKKILAVCERLDEAQKTFQKKAEESEASLQALESNHRKAEKEVKDAFSSVVSTAIERQAEALEELSAKVKSERLHLEEQLDHFRSMQAATQSAADYGRRLISLSLASQLTKASADLEKTAADLKEKVTTPVAAAATFQVGTEKLEELRALLESLGTIKSQAAATAAVPTGVRDLPLVFPDIRLDGRRCHGDCTVSADGWSLSNQPHPPSPSQSQQKFRFRGTCGTVALPGLTCYWQVHVKALPNLQIAERCLLCEVGAASMEALQATGTCIGNTGHTALTVFLYPSGGSVEAFVYRCGTRLTDTVLAPFNPHSPVERTLGFLLDAQRKRLAILDVDGRQTCYWQVHVKALPSPQIAEGYSLCEVGVASLEDLQVCRGNISTAGHSALTFFLYPSGGNVKAVVYQCKIRLAEKVLAPFNPHSPVDRTLGFLLDAQRKRLAILDVDGRQVLCEREVAMSQPLWPCVSVVYKASRTKTSVCVRVESGQHVTLTPDMVSLIRSLLK